MFMRVNSRCAHYVRPRCWDFFEREAVTRCAANRELRRSNAQHHFDARGARALFSGRPRYSGRMRTLLSFE
jgi:hypothetical protein